MFSSFGEITFLEDPEKKLIRFHEFRLSPRHNEIKSTTRSLSNRTYKTFNNEEIGSLEIKRLKKTKSKRIGKYQQVSQFLLGGNE